jgi:histidine triad (HIT) family protein
MATETIFTKIITGQIPCHKIYEDEYTFAFLDIHPQQPGHTLVVPKQPVEFLWDLPPALYQAVMATSQRIALHLRETLTVPYVAARVIGVDVPHTHVHLIPFHSSADLTVAHSSPSDETLATLAKQLVLPVQYPA